MVRISYHFYTKYNIYISLCTQTADPNPFLGTHCSKKVELWALYDGRPEGNMQNIVSRPHQGKTLKSPKGCVTVEVGGGELEALLVRSLKLIFNRVLPMRVYLFTLYSLLWKGKFLKLKLQIRVTDVRYHIFFLLFLGGGGEKWRLFSLVQSYLCTQ